MPSHWTQQPSKAFYIATVLPVTGMATMVRLAASSVIRSLRPSQTWSFAKSASVMFVRDGYPRHFCAIRSPAPLSLKPGAEGDRFRLIPEAHHEQITGAADDAEIRPETTGGTWTPAVVPRRDEGADQKELLVALHLHGGAYVIGDGRDDHAGFIAQSLIHNTPCTHVFSPQYRLSNNPGGRFPAALQDAIAAYSYLLNDIGIPASKIVLSGDSAGGNLALALLRYISDHGISTGLPWPSSVLLWSPWVDIASALDPSNMESNRNYSVDCLHSSFLNWGAEALTDLGVVSAENPYISPVRKPFLIEVPVWVQVGDKEVFYDDMLEFVQAFRSTGNSVDLSIDEDAPHDIIMMAKMLQFVDEAIKSAVKAGEFLKTVGSKK
ncbi:alpha/beta hydrolase [Thelonectria olida]|uniref:Alpha/beta hydrolase n=1 Tax=Thelonectria olida TaxID=1576542 RepID=A0A9P9AN74_9HYPO|nr:alpha/beta hydrolase [Thelonectria olida]